MSARSFYISMAVASLILLAGALLFPDSEPALLAAQIASFTIGMWLFHRLDDQDRRREQQQGHRGGSPATQSQRSAKP